MGMPAKKPVPIKTKPWELWTCKKTTQFLMAPGTLIVYRFRQVKEKKVLVVDFSHVGFFGV